MFSEDFKKLIKKFKLKLSQSLVNELIRAFELETSQIDLMALKKCYLKEFPDTQPPPRESQGSRRKSRLSKRKHSARKTNARKSVEKRTSK